MIVGVAGKMGSGKDELVRYLVRKHGFIQVGLADPFKRFAQEVLDLTDDQVWGASEFRDAPDKRYVSLKKGALGSSILRFTKKEGKAVLGPNPPEDRHLIPRDILIKLGVDWGRDSCHKGIWIDYLRKVHSAIMNGASYSQKYGIGPMTELVLPGTRSVAVSDLRFRNDVRGIQDEGGLVFRVKRMILTNKDLEIEHSSETALDDMDDMEFDAVIENPPGKKNFYALIDQKLVPKIKGSANQKQRKKRTYARKIE